jgi:putative aldouronate transport system permease protein
MASLENVSYGRIKHRKKTAASDKVFNAFIYAFFIVFAIVTIYPVINTLAYSLSDGMDALRKHIWFFPRIWSLESYRSILFERESIRKAAVTTLSRTLIGTAAGLAANTLLAFIISRKRFVFKRGLSLFWLITIYAHGGLVTTLTLYRKLHLTQNFWVYIIPCLVSGLYVLVIRTYMKEIPDSLEEAAKLEGAGYMRIFWSVISPVCKPVYAAIALFIATSQWNSWFDAMVYNRFKPEYTTLQYELMKYLTSVATAGQTPPNTVVEYPYTPTRITPITLRSALAVVAMLPLIIIYPFFQKYFVSGITVRRIKD